jgi:hypothetical protein
VYGSNGLETSLVKRALWRNAIKDKNRAEQLRLLMGVDEYTNIRKCTAELRISILPVSYQKAKIKV